MCRHRIIWLVWNIQISAFLVTNWQKILGSVDFSFIIWDKVLFLQCQKPSGWVRNVCGPGSVRAPPPSNWFSILLDINPNFWTAFLLAQKILDLTFLDLKLWEPTSFDPKQGCKNAAIFLTPERQLKSFLARFFHISLMIWHKTHKHYLFYAFLSDWKILVPKLSMLCVFYSLNMIKLNNWYHYLPST